MHLNCPKCSAEVGGQDVNIGAAIARCPRCFAVFSFNAAQIQGQAAAVAFPRPLAPRPPHLNVDDSGLDLHIWWNWLHWGLIPMALFSIVWNGFLVVWYAIAIDGVMNQGAGPGQDAGFWIMLLFPILHVAVGVSLGYGTLTGFLNTTTIEVEGGMLRVRHGPLPWFGNLELDVHAIQQLYCVTSSGASGSFTMNEQSHYHSYDLAAMLNDGTKAVILSAQSEPEMVWFLEQTLERKLKIEDQRVGGEVVG